MKWRCWSRRCNETRYEFHYSPVNLTSSIAPSAPHRLHQGTPTSRPWSKESSSGATDHGSIIRPRSLASHPPPWQLIIGSDLITAALKNLYIPTMWEDHEVRECRGEVTMWKWLHAQLWSETQIISCSHICSLTSPLIFVIKTNKQTNKTLQSSLLCRTAETFTVFC